jgi:isopentenyldiphosphate isomerase
LNPSSQRPVSKAPDPPGGSTNQSELLDVFDANLVHLGVETRERVHAQGLWHQTFHLWLATQEHGGALIFQRRGQVLDFPNRLDITAAGHLLAGEAPIDGLREVQEELGIALSDTALVPLGYRTEAMDLPDGRFNREHQAVFMAHSPVDLADFSPSFDEVAELVEIRLPALFDLLTGKVASAPARVLRSLTETETWVIASDRVGVGELLPRLPAYYLAAAIMAERFLEGRSPIAIG